MNILYISKLDGRPWAGPTYSVPRQIEAQSQIDNVFWYNQCHGSKSRHIDVIEQWKTNDYYHDLDDYPKGRIKELPFPFNNPDIIVIEQCYPYAKSKILIDLLFLDTPYVVIPRGEFTRSAQKRKHIKKAVANKLIFNKLIKAAVAIQFLTREEKETTDSQWIGNEAIVLPNGVDITKNEKSKFNSDVIKCISIGRISVFHKGLDLLISACASIKQELIDGSVIIDIYGPDRENNALDLQQEINTYGMEDIIYIHDGVYGNEKADLLMNSDVFVMTSRFEGHSTGLLEALSYGIPCLVTTGTNMRTEIEMAHAGWTADNDSESIRNALLSMISDKALFQEKGRNARNLSMEYDWGVIAHRAHDIYEGMIFKNVKISKGK